MALEIERKFLLANDAWKHEVRKSEHLRDGLIARFGDGKVRVRLAESSAWLTIKGPADLSSSTKFRSPKSSKCCEDLSGRPYS